MNKDLRELAAQDQDKVTCTAKGIKALSEDSNLKGRERQYCLLLSRGDEMSHFISEQMRQKVNFEYLLNEGYIELNETDVSEMESQLSKSSPVSSILDGNLDAEDSTFNGIERKGKEEPEVDAILRLLAGNI